MSDTTSKDEAIREAIKTTIRSNETLGEIAIESMVDFIKQYGIQERIDEAELLRLKQYTVPDPIKPRSQEIRAVSVFDIDDRITELTALKTKQEVAN